MSEVTRTGGTSGLQWVLGAWFMMTVAMAFAAITNFRTVDRLPRFDEVYAGIPEGETRRLSVRYLSSEINRRLFTVYSQAQLALAAAALWLLYRSGGGTRLRIGALCLGLLGALLFAFWLTPDLVDRGREIDFVSREPEPPEEVQSFMRLHRVTETIEIVKMIAILYVSVAVARRRMP